MNRYSVVPSLAGVIRGLSCLFWGLPLTLLLTAKTAVPDPFLPVNPLTGLLAHGLLLYGFHQLSHFQPQERIWAAARERAVSLALLQFGLFPFAYWWARRPDEPYFQRGFALLLVAGFATLAATNLVLKRLAAMLPDETLRSETRFFVALNLRILFGVSLLGVGLILTRIGTPQPGPLWPLYQFFERIEPWQILLPGLLPLALTMTLLWKTKEVVLTSLCRAPSP
ncbi:MAG: hypothetical protein EXS36_14880 [Pedosphaera sp.]|nr:hypothetical protein [Pedosphaera sp.]